MCITGVKKMKRILEKETVCYDGLNSLAEVLEYCMENIPAIKLLLINTTKFI